MAKILSEKTYTEIAEELGIGYKSVTAAYARLIKKIKQEIGGVDE